MKVCVTGGAGFIGWFVGHALKEAGHHVIILDQAKRHSYVDDWIMHEWMQADITQPLAKIDGLDAVIHLAAVSHPRDCDADPVKAFAVNVNGTHQVLKMALASGASKVVFSSSAHVYDIPPKYMPTDELHPLRLNNTYTTTKLLGEQLCQLYFENHGLGYTTLRLYNAYGPGQQLGYFIPDMIQKAQSGSITLLGGNTTKDWVWVEDVARAFVLALETDFVGPINIGTGVQTDLASIASRITRLTTSTVITSDSPTATRMQADIGRAERVLEWKPTKTIEEGLDAILGASAAVR